MRAGGSTIVRVLRGAGRAAVLAAALLLSSAVPAAAAESKAGDVSGNLPWQVVLLIPTLLLLLFVTSFALSGSSEPTPIRRREGGVTRALGHGEPDPPDDPPPPA